MVANIHINSLSLRQVNILTRNDGALVMTFDQKVESNGQLLRCPFVLNLDIRDIVGTNEYKLRDTLKLHIFTVEVCGKIILFCMILIKLDNKGII